MEPRSEFGVQITQRIENLPNMTTARTVSAIVHILDSEPRNIFESEVGIKRKPKTLLVLDINEMNLPKLEEMVEKVRELISD